MALQSVDRRMYRSRDACIGGVCAGVAEHFDFDPIAIRILAVLLVGLTLGLAGLFYVIMWVYIPKRPAADMPYEVQPESAESSAFGCVDCTAGFGSANPTEVSGMSITVRLAVAAALMLLFLAVAVNVAPLVPGTKWWQFWPLAFLISGLCLIIIPIPVRSEMAWHAAGVMLASISASILPMSLGIMSWMTIANTFHSYWVLVVLAVVLYGVGLYKKMGILLGASALCIVIFCLVGLVACSLPGAIDLFLVQMPSGHAMKISLVGR